MRQRFSPTTETDYPQSDELTGFLQGCCGKNNRSIEIKYTNS